MVHHKDIGAESFESDNQDHYLGQNEVAIPNILINSLDVIVEEDTQRTR